MLSSVLKSFMQYKLRTFTYYIPSPPKRKTGYQEKEFDQLVAYINKENFKIENIQTQLSSNHESSGMWVVLQIRPLCRKSNAKELQYEIEDDSTQNLDLEIEVLDA